MFAVPGTSSRLLFSCIQKKLLVSASCSNVGCGSSGYCSIVRWENIGWACNKKQAGDFATRPSTEERLRRELVSSVPLGRPPSEKQHARELLGIAIRSSQHSSVGDVRTTIPLFRMEKEYFERGACDDLWN